MILYKDVFTNFDVFTDVYKVELVDDLYYRISGKFIWQDTSIDDSLIGANKSAEEEDAGMDDSKILVADIISNNRLEIAPSIVSKTDYKKAISEYAKKLIKHVNDQDKERATFLKENLQAKFVMPMLKNFKNLKIYAAPEDEFDLVGGLIHFEQECEEGSEAADIKCHIAVLKDSVYEEKC